MNEKESTVPISVIVPLYNREAFLPQLLNTLISQSFQNFEVILVDDGSTDETKRWVEFHFGQTDLQHIYIYQENGGPYKARNNGLRHSKGKYIALFDSDDEWPAYHLEEFYYAMEANPDIDWLFASIKRIEHDSRVVLEESNFYLENGKPHPIITLNTEKIDFKKESLFIINDQKLPETMIEHTLPGSMQCSLIKREVFDFHLFDETFKTAYDRFYCMKTAISGFRFAYLKKTHLIYHVHDDNISTVGNAPAEKLLRSAQTMLRGYKLIQFQANNSRQRSAAVKRLAEVYAWELAMAFQKNRNYARSIFSLWSAVKLKPFNLLFLKSLLVACLKLVVFSVFLRSP